MIRMPARMLLLAMSAAAIGFGGWALTSPLGQVSLQPSHPSQDRVVGKVGAPVLDSLVRFVAGRTPFRASRRPTAVAFDPRRLIDDQGTSTTTPKPVLTLSGIVWGRDPTAVILGLPGIEGSKVVRNGDVVAGIKVNRIERERVWMSGLDTNWTLAVREPWK